MSEYSFIEEPLNIPYLLSTIADRSIDSTKIMFLETNFRKIYRCADRIDENDDIIEMGSNYSWGDEGDFDEKIEAWNRDIGSLGVCAKQMNYGDVAWRCLDCEKDPTCIICSSCFEKGDHTGH